MASEGNGYDLFAVNQNKLDQEWVNFPKTYRIEAGRLADLRKVWEMAKADRDVTVAETSNLVRRTDPVEFGLEKLTEATVSEIVTKKCRKAQQTVIEAKHALDVQQAVVDALDGKKHALQDLVRLRLASYYAEPQVGMPGGVKPEAIRKPIRK